MNNSVKPNLDYTCVPSINDQKNVIICLHGYGSNKEDFLRLAPFMQEKLHNTTFIIPNAPNQCHDDFMLESALNSYMWFPLKLDETGINIINMETICEASKTLNTFILYVQKAYNITTDKITLLGFSQGGILALYNSVYNHNNTYMGVISHSGAFFSYEPFAKSKINNKQKVLLLHGKIDYIVPYEFFVHTINFLNKYDIQNTSYIKDDMGHYIEQDTLNKVIEFVLNNQDA